MRWKRPQHTWWLGGCLAGLVIAILAGGFSLPLVVVFVGIFGAGAALIALGEPAGETLAAEPDPVPYPEPPEELEAQSLGDEASEQDGAEGPEEPGDEASEQDGAEGPEEPGDEASEQDGAEGPEDPEDPGVDIPESPEAEAREQEGPEDPADPADDTPESPEAEAPEPATPSVRPSGDASPT